MARQRPRILFVGAFPPPGRAVYGGVVTSCRALLQSSLPDRAELVLVDSTQITNPPPGFLVRLYLATLRFADFVRKFERGRPDAVILFVATGASVVEKGVMAWYTRIRRVPALLFPRGGSVIDACRSSAFTRIWTRWAFRGGRKILCQGPAWHRFAVDVLGFPAEDAPIISNWTASAELLAIGANRTHANETVRLLFVGWMDREKGIVELLEACAALETKRPFTLTLIGEGNISDYAQQFVAENGLENVVEFRGWLESDLLHEEFAAGDVFVLPSWVEGLPNAMIEAMAAGLAIVATPVGNVPSAVADGESALFVQPRSATDLRNVLSRVIEDGALRASLGARAHAVAAERFGVEPAVQRILEAVASVSPEEVGA